MAFNRKISAISFIVLLNSIVGASADPVIVQILQGKVQGLYQNKLYSFKGIPYAQAPIGRLRWHGPQDPVKRHTVTDARNFGPKCLQQAWAGQPESKTSEDCLTLNVWTPALDSGKRPVMVYIHGGGFRGGSGNIPGEVFAAHDTVVVSMNYRLGPLGFFSHEALPGFPANPGVLDMIKALQWVQTNIARFGGDRNNVTIFGVSAGGMAVNLLMTNNRSKGLVHKAIAQSGYAAWALPRNSSAPQPGPKNVSMQNADRAEVLSRKLVTRISGEQQTAEMLYRLKGSDLVNALEGFQVPIVDGDSITEEPGIQFILGKQLDIPYMSGGNSYEGSVMAGSGVSIVDYKKVLGGDYDKARKLYSNDSDSIWLPRMWGDNRYLLSARVLADNMKHKSAKSWLYYIDFIAEENEQNSPGTSHGSDGYFMFQGHKHENASVRMLSKEIQQYWLAFARNGNPNVKGLEQWPTYERGTDNWMVFSDTRKVKAGVIEEKLNFIESKYRERVADSLGQ